MVNKKNSKIESKLSSVMNAYLRAQFYKPIN